MKKVPASKVKTPRPCGLAFTAFTIPAATSVKMQPSLYVADLIRPEQKALLARKEMTSPPYEERARPAKNAPDDSPTKRIVPVSVTFATPEASAL